MAQRRVCERVASTRFARNSRGVSRVTYEPAVLRVPSGDEAGNVRWIILDDIILDNCRYSTLILNYLISAGGRLAYAGTIRAFPRTHYFNRYVEGASVL